MEKPGQFHAKCNYFKKIIIIIKKVITFVIRDLHTNVMLFLMKDCVLIVLLIYIVWPVKDLHVLGILKFMIGLAFIFQVLGRDVIIVRIVYLIKLLIHTT